MPDLSGAHAHVMLAESMVHEFWVAPDLFVRRALALSATLAILIGIAAILRPRGLAVVFCALTYVVSLVGTQLTISLLSSPPYGYRYSSSLTVLHFLFVWLAMAVYMAFRGEFGKASPFAVFESRRKLAIVAPIAVCGPMTVIFNNKGLLYVGPALCAIIGTLSPVSVAVLSRVVGRRHSIPAWVGICVAFLGALIVVRNEMTAIKGDEDVDIAGVFFALASVGMRCVKIVVLDTALVPSAYRDGEKTPLAKAEAQTAMSPMDLYALQAPWCFATSLLYALATEDVGAAAVAAAQGGAVLELLLITCVFAVVVNIAGIIALRDLGGTSQQIIGKLNTIIVSALSMAFMGEDLSRPVIFGGCVVLLGVAVYERGAQIATLVEQRSGAGWLLQKSACTGKV